MGKSYLEAQPFLDRLGQGMVLEIGSERGEGSTRWLQDLAQARGRRFVTVDIDPARQLDFLVPGSSQVTASGSEFVRDQLPWFGDAVALAYLDNFDWTWDPGNIPDWMHRQIDWYRNSLNTVMDNTSSQTEHFLQAVGIERVAAADGCLMVFDDTWRTREGVYMGKGGMAANWLLHRGFSVVSAQNNALCMHRG